MYKIHYYDISRNSDSNVECELDPNATANDLFDILIHNQWIAKDQIYQIRNINTNKVFLGMRSFKDMVDRPNAPKEFRVEKWVQPAFESQDFKPQQAFVQSGFIEDHFMPPSLPPIILRFNYGGTVAEWSEERHEFTPISEILMTLSLQFDLEVEYCSLWTIGRGHEFTNKDMPIQNTNTTEFELVYRKPQAQAPQQLKQVQQQNQLLSFEITCKNETKTINIPKGVIRVGEFVRIIYDQNLFKNIDPTASRLVVNGRVFCHEQNDLIDSLNERQLNLLCPWAFYQDEYITININYETQKKPVTFQKTLTLNDIAKQDIFQTGNLNYVYTDEKGLYLNMNSKLSSLKDKQTILQRLVTSLSNQSSPLKQVRQPQKVEQPLQNQKRLNLRYKNEVKSIERVYGLTIQQVIQQIESLFKVDKLASRFMARNRVFDDEQTQLIDNFQEDEFTILCPWRMFETDYIKIRIQEYRTKSIQNITFAKAATLQQLADLDLFNSKQAIFAFTDNMGNIQKMTNQNNLNHLVLYQGNEAQQLQQQNVNKIPVDIHFEQKNITLFIEKYQHISDICIQLVQKNFIQQPDQYKYVDTYSKQAFFSNESSRDLETLVQNGRIDLQIQRKPQIQMVNNNSPIPIRLNLSNSSQQQQSPQPMRLVQKLIFPDGSVSQEITIIYNANNYQQAKSQLDILAEQYQRR